MRKTVLLSTVALLAGIGMASAQAPGQEHSGGASQAQSQRQGSTAQQTQTKEQAGQARHEQGATQGRHEQGAQNMPGKSGTAAQAEQRNEGKREQTTGQKQQTTGQNQQRNEHAGSRAEQNREGTTNGQRGQAFSQPEKNQNLQKEGQQVQPGNQGRNAQQTQQGNQGRNAQQTQQRNLNPQQGQTTTGAASPQRGQANQQGQTGINAQQQTGQAGRAGNATVTLNESQRSHIQQTVFARSDVPRVDRVDFALAVGTVVPERVHVVAVPDALWEINPEWRSDMYFVSGDDIIIIDNSRRIVAVVASGPSTAMNSGTYNSYASARGSSSGSSVNLSSEEIRHLQIALNEKGFNVGSPDGVFGARTRQALIAFQRQQGFQANGEIDQQSMAALGVSANGNMGGKTTGAGGQSSSSTATPSSSGQAGGTNMPASRNGSSTTGQGRSNLPSSSTSGQGGTSMPQGSGGKNMPSHTQGSGSTNLPSGSGNTGASGGTNLPSNQSR